MSRLLAVALAAVMLFAAVPAFAAEVAGAPARDAGEDAASDCANPDGLEVVTLDGSGSEIAAPGQRLVDTETKSFIVDLGGESADATGELSISLAWDALLNDYDLEVTADDTVARSENAQPFDASEESVTLTVSHCQVVEVVAYNFFALQPATTLALSFGAVGAVEDGAAAAAVPSLAALDALTGQEALEVLEAEVREAEAAQAEAAQAEAL